MSIRLSSWLRGATLAGALLAAGCAGFNASALQPGVSTLPQIEAALGKPAMVWKNPDGTSQLAYPFGPSGTQTFMVFVGADGKLQRIIGVLNEAQFGLVQAGMTKEQVLRILGPSGALWTQTFPRTNTLAWTRPDPFLHPDRPRRLRFGFTARKARAKAPLTCHEKSRLTGGSWRARR
jgi:hypothetical protein